MKPFEFDKQPKISAGFTTPEGYFEKSAAEILSQMKAQPKRLSLWERNKKMLLASAAVVVFGLSVSLFWNSNPKEYDEAHWLAVETYVTEHVDLTDEAYIDYFNKNDFENLYQSQNESKVIEEVLLENSDFENYILQ